MFTAFFNHQEPLALDVLPANSDTTGSYHPETVLPKVVQAISSERPIATTQNVLLLHDIASPHKTKDVTQDTAGHNIQVLLHPPYSPDLATSDCWLFPLLKDKLAERKVSLVQDLAKVVNSELKPIPKEEYRKAFSNRLRRLQHCINIDREYFDGMS